MRKLCLLEYDLTILLAARILIIPYPDLGSRQNTVNDSVNDTIRRNPESATMKDVINHLTEISLTELKEVEENENIL